MANRSAGKSNGKGSGGLGFKIRIFNMLLTNFPLFQPKSELLSSLFAHLLVIRERLELLTPVALYQKFHLCDSLRLLISKEQQRVICSHHSLKKSKSVNHSKNKPIPLSLFRSQKTSDSLAKQMSEFPTLHIRVIYMDIFKVGHRVLFRSERSVLFRSKKRTLRSFPFLSRVFGDL